VAQLDFRLTILKNAPNLAGHEQCRAGFRGEFGREVGRPRNVEAEHAAIVDAVLRRDTGGGRAVPASHDDHKFRRARGSPHFGGQWRPTKSLPARCSL